MRLIGMALAAGALALAGCGQSGQTGAQQQADAGGAFPQFGQVSFRQEIQMTHEGRSAPAIIVRSGQNQRMEISSDQGTMIIIVNNETGEAYTLMPAQRRAMRIPMNEVLQTAESMWASGTAASTLVGPCSVIGQTGREFTRTDEDGVHTGCVTQDGILLRASNGEEVAWETTALTRGPQDAALFAIPPDYQVMDLGAMMQGLPNVQDMMEKYQAQTGQ